MCFEPPSIHFTASCLFSTYRVHVVVEYSYGYKGNERVALLALRYVTLHCSTSTSTRRGAEQSTSERSRAERRGVERSSDTKKPTLTRSL